MAKKQKKGYGKRLSNGTANNANNAPKATAKEPTVDAQDDVLHEDSLKAAELQNLPRLGLKSHLPSERGAPEKAFTAHEKETEKLSEKPINDQIKPAQNRDIAMTYDVSAAKENGALPATTKTTAVEDAINAIARRKSLGNDRFANNTNGKVNGKVHKEEAERGKEVNRKEEASTDVPTKTYRTTNGAADSKVNSKINDKNHETPTGKLPTNSSNTIAHKTNGTAPNGKTNGNTNGNTCTMTAEKTTGQKDANPMPNSKERFCWNNLTENEEDRSSAKNGVKGDKLGSLETAGIGTNRASRIEADEYTSGRSNDTNDNTNNDPVENVSATPNSYINAHSEAVPYGISNGSNGAKRETKGGTKNTNTETSGATTSEHPGNICTGCSKVTVRTCGGCVDAPSYIDMDGHTEGVAETFYCSPECQRKDWPRHKIECQKLQARKMLQKADTILKSAYLRIQKCASPSLDEKISEVGNKRIYRDKLAALLGESSELAMVYLSTLTEGLLEDLTSNIQEVSMKRVQQRNGSKFSKIITHFLYKTTLKCDSTVWALSPVNSLQQPFADNPFPWSEYMRHQSIYRETELGEARTRWERVNEVQIRDQASSHAFQFLLALDKHLNNGIFQKKGRKLSDLPKASSEEIETFLDGLESAIMEAIRDPEPIIAPREAGDETLQDRAFALPGGEHMDTTVTPQKEEAYAKQLSSSSKPELPESFSEWYTFKEFPGKGVGAVAAKFIPGGTRILAEAPIFTVPRYEYDKAAAERVVNRRVSRLSQSQRERFFALSNCYAGSSDQQQQCGRAMGITRTNTLPLGDGSPSEGGLFLEAARFNHACRYNAQNTWNPKLGMVTIHAFEDRGIQPGEEITISYQASTENTYRRQAQLRASFGFECHCSGLCGLSEEERAASDRRIDRILELDKTLGDGLRMHATPLACLRDVRKLLDILQEEDGGQDSRTPRAYYDAFQIAITHSDEARARMFAQRAYERYMALQGEDGPTTEKMKAYVQHPSSHSLYGTTRQWRQGTEKIPRDVTDRELEDWLWRKRT